MTRRGRRAALAAALLGAGALAVVMMSRDDGTAPAGAVASRQAPGSSASSREIPVTDLKLELLETPRGELPEPQRNPFRFQAGPALAQPRPVAPPQAIAPSPPRLTAPAGPPPPPPIPLRFIGLVDAPTQAGRVAIMSDGRGNVFYGKEGDIIEGRYRVLKVSPDTVELSHIDGQGRQMIRLSGQ